MIKGYGKGGGGRNPKSKIILIEKRFRSSGKNVKRGAVFVKMKKLTSPG